MSNGNMITTEEITKRFGVVHATVYHWVRKGKLVPAGKRGKTFIFDANQVNQFAKMYLGEQDDGHDAIMVPTAEDVYPFNLIQHVIGCTEECEDPPYTIWDVNVAEFRKHISKLTDGQQRVLELRYHFSKTLDETGFEIGVTRERVRQIQAIAERKLRSALYHGSFESVPKIRLQEANDRIAALEAENEQLRKLLDKSEDADKEETKDIPAIPGVRIEDLDLDVRSYNCLKRAGLNTLQDIITFDQFCRGDVNEPAFRYKNWKEIRNFGRRSFIETGKAVFRACGYMIGSYSDRDKRDAQGEFLENSWSTMKDMKEEVK